MEHRYHSFTEIQQALVNSDGSFQGSVEIHQEDMTREKSASFPECEI